MIAKDALPDLKKTAKFSISRPTESGYWIPLQYKYSKNQQ